MLAGERVPEREAGGVEKLPPEAQVARSAVGRIAGDGQVDRREVNADLMRPPGLEPSAEKRVPGEELDELERGHGFPGRGRVERVARGVAAIAADGRFDPPGTRARSAANEDEVLAHELPPAQEPLQPTVRLVRAGYDEQP